TSSDGYRVTTVGPTQTTSVDGVHDFGATGDSRERHTAGDTFCQGNKIRFDAFDIRSEPGTGANKAGLDFIGDKQHIVGFAPLDNLGQEPLGGHDEATFALDGFHDDGGQVVGTDLGLQRFNGASGSFFATETIAVRVGARHAIQFGCERAEGFLIRHVFGGQAHGQGGATVIGVIEGRNSLFTGVGACNFDSVLNGFGTGVQQHGAGLAGDRGKII